LSQIAEIFGYTLINESATIRPAAMSIVKPSELVAIIRARADSGDSERLRAELDDFGEALRNIEALSKEENIRAIVREAFSPVAARSLQPSTPASGPRDKCRECGATADGCEHMEIDVEMTHEPEGTPASETTNG
jgi:hypothetical protein